MGNGYAMALKAGLPLRSMEFNGYYPVGLPTPTGRYVHCAPVTLMMRNAALLNDKGEDIVRKHFGISLQEAVPPPGVRFDWLPRAVAAEVEQGKVWLDLTKVPPEEWDNLPERNWKQIRQTQVDMKKTPLPIMPMSHHFYGGLIIDTSMRTSLPGLYAAGEVVAGWRAERAHGNLPSCLAMGAITGRESATEIVNVKAPSQEARDEGLEMAQALLGKDGKTKPEGVCEEIRDIVYRHNSPIKSKTSLEEGLKKLERLEKQSADMSCQSMQALKEALEAEAMLLTSNAMLRSALLRAESRGAYYRRDFPIRDDKNWLGPVLTSYNAKSGEVTVKKGEKIAPSSYRV
jgi:succinate dehydrogenase/fumarate reductase flavoprotein subunit